MTIKVSTRADPAQEFMRTYGKEFEQAHSGVSVVVEDIPATEYFVKIRALAASKQVGDVVWGNISGGAFLNFAAMGIIRPLDDLAKREGANFLKQWYAPAVAVGSLDGKLYALPEIATPGNAVLVWNETAFGEAGVPAPTLDWDLDKDFLPAADKLTKRSGDRVERFGTDLDKTYLGLVPMLRRWGGEFISPDGKKCLLDSPGNEKPVQFMLDLHAKYKVAPSPQQIEENSTKMFVAGKVASLLAVPIAVVATNRAAVGEKFKYSGMLTPKGPAGRGTMLAANHNGISSLSQVVDQAWELLKLYSSKEVGIKKVSIGSGSPGARPDVYNDPQLHQYDPIYKIAAVAMEDVGPHLLPYNVRGSEMMKVLDNEMDKVWLGKVDVAAGIKNATAEVQKVLDQPR